MLGSGVKRRVVNPFQKLVLNPLVKAAFELGIPPPGDALLETIGRRSGQARTTPVCDGLEGDTSWVIAQHGRMADYVRNLEANPRVRVRVSGESGAGWRAGTAHHPGPRRSARASADRSLDQPGTRTLRQRLGSDGDRFLDDPYRSRPARLEKEACLTSRPIMNRQQKLLQNYCSTTPVVRH